MNTQLSIGYITGTERSVKSHFDHDELITGCRRRTLGQMFFQPYESEEEFIFCARHTLVGAGMMGLAVFNPILLFIAIPVVTVGLSAISAAIGGISKLCGSEGMASFFFDAAKTLMMNLCQNFIDLVVFPLSAVVMLTRGISTGLHAAGIVGEHEEGLSPSPSN